MLEMSVRVSIILFQALILPEQAPIMLFQASIWSDEASILIIERLICIFQAPIMFFKASILPEQAPIMLFQASILIIERKHDTVPLQIVEVNATFQGGDLLKFKKYITNQIIFPLEANIRKWSGKTYIRFIVDWDGKVKDVSVLKSSGYKVLDDEAFRVVKASPVWTPALSNGVYVPQIIIFPIIYKALGVTRYETETTGPTNRYQAPPQSFMK